MTAQVQERLPRSGEEIRRHYATQCLEAARTAWRGRQYERAFEMISRGMELDPSRAQTWEKALAALVQVLPHRQAPRAGRVVRSGMWGQSVECSCGRIFGRPNGDESLRCLRCQTRARLSAAGITADDAGLTRIAAHNQRAKVVIPE